MVNLSEIDELKDFYKKLKAYKRYLSSPKQISEAQKRYRDSLREKLVNKIGILKPIIVELTSKQYYKQLGRVQDFWDEGLSASGYPPSVLTSLDFCIDATNEAIGKLEAEKDTRTAGIKWTKEDVIRSFREALTEADKGRQVEIPELLFGSMQFHPKVIKASKSLFDTGHYSQAIFEAFKAVNNFVKEKSGLTPNEIRGMKDSKLMGKVFDVNNPVIKINELISDTDISEQEGFKFLFMGATLGIRNPKAHDFIEMEDPYKTLEYLAFASLLLKKISFWKVD